ncbi:uncharacterized protein LOC114290913 [Camellia sinensis]|uniref:uncharacterized protein LOC114290913 n=1 Tax=Camellia sinensis TaxID=4442 RepID=UPI001036187E|nr:uncharacterized protein LOC114290913 [Camellia sinensis]
MVLLQENKRSTIDEKFVRSIWGREQMDFMAVDSAGAAGGLLCIWNPEVFQLVDCCSNRYLIILSGTIYNSFECVILNIYGPNDMRRRKVVWDSLARLKLVYNKPWCLGGDFNEIMSISERKGCSRRDKGMREFNELIDNLEVVDLSMMGRKFTWCNSQEGEKWSRIDRFLLSPEWLQMFNFKFWGLPRKVSDHCPILLMEDERDCGPTPFRFLNAWTLHPKFRSFVENTWLEANVVGWAGFKCLRKLKILKLALKQWAKEVFGDVEHKLNQVEEEIHALDISAEERPLSMAEQARRREAKGVAWKLSKIVEWAWIQKSRIKWPTQGDRNTKFFHIMASSRRVRNSLCSIAVNGTVKEDPVEVRAAVQQHFINQFTEPWRNRPRLSGPFVSIGDREVVELLEAKFSENEIVAAVKSCEGNKAPGPDGFNLMMFKKCWKVIKVDVLQFMQEFHQNAKLVKGINSSFVALIAKNENPSGLNDYRPISLIGSLYKILAKVLANRIKTVLPRIISVAQSAFIGGRNILDWVLIANEIVDGWKKNRKSGIVLKLDFERAYDSINWNFLFTMLSNFGFGVKWISWMGVCLISQSFYFARVAKEFVSIQSNFLWGGDGFSRKIHMVKWKEISKSKQQGGLGVKRIRLMNDCLLLKRWWRFGVEPNALWKQVIDNKYNQVGVGWCPEPVDDPRISCIWADILGVARTRPDLVEFFKENSAPVIGDGKNTLFWRGTWCNNVCLMEVFPRLYSLSLEKFDSVNVMHIRRNSEVEWNLNFRRSFFQWEVEDLNRLKLLLSNAPVLRENMADALHWKADPSGYFTVSSAYKWCDNSLGTVFKVSDLLWNNVSSPRAQFFGWLAWKGRLKTSSFLQRIRVLSDEANVSCIFCNEEVESVNHVLLLCPFVWKVWSHMLKWWGLQWAQPNTVNCLLDWWAGTKPKKQERVFWKAMPLAVLWSIWKLRNDCIFNDIHPNFEELCEVIKVRVAMWSKDAGSFCSGYSVIDIVNNLQQRVHSVRCLKSVWEGSIKQPWSLPVIDQNLYYLGLKNTSATFVSAVVIVLPALTFIMAIIFRAAVVQGNVFGMTVGLL